MQAFFHGRIEQVRKIHRMKFNVNETLEVENEEGLWLDYDSSTWYFFVKDSIFREKEECKRVFHGNVKIQFVQLGHVDLFLLDIFDCLETSDIPFCVKDLDEASFKAILDVDTYVVKIVALDDQNTIKAIRDCALSKEHSKMLQHALEKHAQEEYDVSCFEKEYEALIEKQEPYELEPYALFEETFK